MKWFICLRRLFFCVFVLASVTASANDKSQVGTYLLKIDSMKRLFDDRLLTEKRKMELYKDIANVFHAFNHDSTMSYAHKSLVIAKKLKEQEMQMGLYCTLGLTHSFAANYDSAYIYFDLMQALATKRENKNSEAQALSMFAFTYSKQGKYHTAIEYYLKVLTISETEGWTSGSAGVLANLGAINRRLGNTEMAIFYLKQAEEKCNTLPEGLYAWNMPHICNEYAFIHLKQGDTDLAFHYASKADSINPGTSVNACYSNGLLAAIYLQRKDYDRALQYALKSHVWADELKDKNLYAYAGKILSDVYIAQQRYPEAEAAALKVWDTDSTYIDESREVVENIVLANIYMRQTERAAYYLKKYSELNEQYAEKSYHTTVSDLAVRYETDKKETRIATLEKERRLYAWLGVAGVLLAAFLSVVFWQKQRNTQKEKQLIATNSILDGEMRERTRLAQDLHDRLSGNLSALKIELSKHGASMHNVRNQLDRCIRDIRGAAHNLMPISLQYGMRVALEDFAAQFPNVRFHFFGTEKRILERWEYVVYCFASELVNNSIRHSGAKNINLQLVQGKNYVALTVTDDGCGYDVKDVTKGFGLKSIRNRVASCNGKMDVVSSRFMGTETTIELIIDD